jgi:hypothetical protein
MTLSTRGYSLGQNAWSLEGHYTAALPGDIHDVRLDLADFCIPHFRRTVLRHTGQRISDDKIRVGWEREEPALTPSKEVHAEFREMSYRGKQTHARRLPPDVLRYDFEYDPEADYDEAENDGYEDSNDDEEYEDESDELEDDEEECEDDEES